MRSAGLIVTLCLAMTGFLAADLDQPVEEPPEVLRAGAAHGDPGSQYNLAVRLQSGRDGKPDVAAAIAWYQKAAAAGLPEAQNNLAVAYAQGAGTPKDEKLAAKWFHAAATQGLFEAQKAMIECYAMGRGVEMDQEKSLRWDFIARRTLELRFQKPAGEPHQPLPLPANQLDPIGSPIFQPGGKLKQYGDDRHVEKDRNGTIEIRWPDGKRTVEADGTTSRGESTRVLTTYDKNGNQVSQRFRSGQEVLEMLQDGVELIEYAGTDEDGGKVRIIERVEKGDVRGARRLVRDASEKEQKACTVTFQRDIAGARVQRVRERFGPDGSSLGAEVLETEFVPAEVAFKRAPTRTDPTTTEPSGTQRHLDPGHGPQNIHETELTTSLQELEVLERECGYFPGVTQAQFEQAKISAQQYVFTLPIYPQKTTAPDLSGTPIAALATPVSAPRLIAIQDDLSARYPLGVYGSAIIKRYPWRHAETPNFVLHYINDYDAQPAFRHIESVFLLATTILQSDPGKVTARKSHVFIFPDQVSWGAFKKSQHLSETLAGFAYKEELLFSAVRDQEDYLKLLSHEATHAIVSRLYPGRTWPLWLTEGFAEYVASKTPSLLGVTTVRPSPPRPPVGEIDVEQLFGRLHYGVDGASSAPDAEKFYADSERCVRTLLEKLPSDAFPRFANLMMAGNPPSIALKQTYGDACPDGRAFRALVELVP